MPYVCKVSHPEAMYDMMKLFGWRMCITRTYNLPYLKFENKCLINCFEYNNKDHQEITEKELMELIVSDKIPAPKPPKRVIFAEVPNGGKFRFEPHGEICTKLLSNCGCIYSYVENNKTYYADIKSWRTDVYLAD